MKNLDNRIKAVTEMRRKVKNINQASSYLKERPGVGKFIDNLTKKEVIIGNCKEPTLRRFIKSLDKYYYLITSPVDRKYILNKKIEIEDELDHRQIVIVEKHEEKVVEPQIIETKEPEIVEIKEIKTLKDLEDELSSSKQEATEKNKSYKKKSKFQNQEVKVKPEIKKEASAKKDVKVEYYTKEELAEIEAEEAKKFEQEKFSDDEVDYDEYDKYYDE